MITTFHLTTIEVMKQLVRSAKIVKTRRQRGQALIEYVLTILLCIGAATFINSSIKRGIGRIWLSLAKDIVPGCPGCEVPDDLNN